MLAHEGPTSVRGFKKAMAQVTERGSSPAGAGFVVVRGVFMLYVVDWTRARC
jgi:hypothetical protein